MKRLLILPILSLLGATAFCTGLFSQTRDHTESIFEPVNELVYNIAEDNQLTTNNEIDIEDPSFEEEQQDGSPILTEQSGWVEFTRRPAMMAGTADAPLTTGAPETTEQATTEAPETEAPVTTTEAPETTKAPQTTKAPETTKKPETTKAPTTTKAPATVTDQANKIASIAKGEIGVKESGTNNVKYNTWFYGQKVSGSSYPWCGAFISWCANQAGVSTNVIPKAASASQYKAFFVDQGRYYKYSSGYTPKPGDLVFIDWGGKHGSIDHVGIVVSCEGGYITTVEGNYSDKVASNTYKLNSGKIVGYASPKYK